MLASSHAAVPAPSVRLARAARRSLRTRALFGGAKQAEKKNAPAQAAAPAPAPVPPPPPPPPVVFVSGATGRTGSRCVRELVGAGYKVRAGVRDVSKASAAFADFPVGSVTTVEADVTKPAGLRAAIGDARVVVSAIGAPESEVWNPSGPRNVDGDGGIALVEASKAAGVEHFVMVSSLGTGRFGWPASILNLFWSVLDEKARAERALFASGVPFTVLRPGGMERPVDAEYAQTHGIVLCREDERTGGQVSRLQVAQTAVAAVKHRVQAANKVVEVIAEKREGGTAASRELDRQLESLPARVRSVAAPEGSATSYSTKYEFKPTAASRFLGLMGFAGALPELINGRVAQLAFMGLMYVEATKGATLEAQLAGGVGLPHPWPEALAAGVVLASLPPLLRGVTPEQANAGPFTSRTEALHGRAAMLGLALMAVLEHAHGASTWAHPLPF